MELNDSQMKAVEHMDGPCLVLAGPGSGKTAVLTRRVFRLIKKGVPAGEILVITFTKAAAIEMKERFEKLSDGIYPVTFGTFHSLFWGILQKELGYKNSDIITGNERNKLIKEALTKANIDINDSLLVKSFASELSFFYNKGDIFEKYMPKFVDKSDFKSFVQSYESLKVKYKVIDFDDMLIKAYKLFENKPEILRKWQQRFSYFLVDEMQDMNDIQFKLISLLSQRTNNIFCVGDDDQSIYGFRGANPTLMKEFESHYPSIERILLDHNYRNPRNLVETSCNLISINTNRFEKDIKSTAPEGSISVEEFLDDSKEAEDIVNEIQLLKSTGLDYDNMAILYRNHSDAKYIVDKLVESKIPFYLKEQMPNIYTHFIIYDIETYFQLAIGNETRARLLSVVNRPNRYIHRRSVEVGGNLNGMLKFYHDNPVCLNTIKAFIADLNLIGKMSPCSAVNYIKNVMGYDSFLREEAIKLNIEYEEYKEVLDFFIDVTRDCKTIKQAVDKLNLLRLKIDYENRNKIQDKHGKVGLYTLHSSKGLEFHTVFIIGANDGVIPSNKADSLEEIEAERRLFYVGITRTKKNLHISFTNKKNRDRSRFLDEMKLDYSSSKLSP